MVSHRPSARRGTPIRDVGNTHQVPVANDDGVGWSDSRESNSHSEVGKRWLTGCVLALCRLQLHVRRGPYHDNSRWT